MDKTGYGSINIETKELSKLEFKILEKDFRGWISKRKRRGSLLSYEKEMEK